MQKRTLVDSFNAAIEGIVYTVKSQRNMRLHFLLAIAVILLAIFLNVNKVEVIILVVAISSVLVAEMFNTAVEKIIDLITPDFHQLAQVVKDIAAGCVLLTAVSSVVIGYLIFSEFLMDFHLSSFLLKVRHSPWHITVLSLILVFVLVVFAKSPFKKGRPLRGGMPSGHAAVAFSLWTIVAILSKDELIIILSLVMAILIAQSRFRNKIHTKWEIVAGGLVGILVTLLCFQIF